MRNITFVIFLFLITACNSTQPAGENESLGVVSATEREESNSAVTPQLKTIVTDSFTVDYIMGKFNPETHPDFATINKKYADESGYRLRKDAYIAFLSMHKAALKDKIDLKILSATRPFDRQKAIWEAKWNGARKVDGQDLSKTIPDSKERALKILTYSSMPGTSRHHWGTEIDLNSLEPDFFESGHGAKIYEWLAANAGTYGYCQPYSPKGDVRPHGYNEEKWHWSYNPIALKLTKLAEENLKNEMISGFQGAEAAPKIDVVSKYVLGINHECK